MFSNFAQWILGFVNLLRNEKAVDAYTIYLTDYLQTGLALITRLIRTLSSVSNKTYFAIASLWTTVTVFRLRMYQPFRLKDRHLDQPLKLNQTCWIYIPLKLK